MDSSLYKNVTTSRGLKYQYWFSPAAPPQPTFLLVHGFPSSSKDWRYVVPHLIQRGYGVLAFDLLGHGQTDKPTDPALYAPSIMSRDVIEILDAEGLDRVIAVGHDWCVSCVLHICR